MWTPAAYAWSWPVQGKVLQAFSYDEAHPYAAGQHRGIDIGADAAGGTVVAPAAGTVSFAGTVPTSGKSVTIETADGYSVTLTHLGSIGVAKGVSVTEGGEVGTIGPSGTPEVEGPYVHLGVRLTTDPNGYVDPLGLLPSVTAESSTDSDSTALQPSSSGGSATASGGASSTSPPAPPATQPTTQPTTSEPVSRPASTPGTSTNTRVQTRAPSHGREHPQPRAQSHSRRAQDQPDVQLGRDVTARPASAARRPVVETTAPVEPIRLGAGHEIHPSAHAPQPAPARRPVPGTVLPVFLNGTAATFAVGAALVAARGRRRRCAACPTAAAPAGVVHLPSRLVEHRSAARAA